MRLILALFLLLLLGTTPAFAGDLSSLLRDKRVQELEIIARHERIQRYIVESKLLESEIVLFREQLKKTEDEIKKLKDKPKE